MYMSGWSFGLFFENVGGDGRSAGRKGVACEIAVCTSVAAASRLLSRLNCSVNDVKPWVLLEVTSSSPLICMNWRSRGVATVLPIVSGLAPGYAALTTMIG